MSDQTPPDDSESSPWTLPEPEAVEEPALVGAGAPAEATAGFRPGVVATGATPKTNRSGPPKGVLRRSTLSRLGPHSRSVVVPAVLVLIVSVLGIGMFLAAATVISLSLTDDGDPTPQECRERTAELQRGIQEFRGDRGRDPRSLNEIIPEYVEEPTLTHTVSFSGVRPRVVIFEDSACDVVGARDGATITSDSYDQGAMILARAAVAGGLLLLFAGVVALPAMALMGWWMANAYRCVIPGRRKYPVRAAYTPLKVYIGGAFFLLAVVLLALSHLVEDPLGFALVINVAEVIVAVAMVWSILRWLSMLAQVNHSFGRMSFAARLVRGSVIWGVAQVILIPLGVFVAAAVSADHPAIALTILVLLLANVVLVIVVGAVSYIVAVVLATVQIERSLQTAADELTRLDQAGWLAVEQGPRKR